MEGWQKVLCPYLLQLPVWRQKDHWSLLMIKLIPGLVRNPMSKESRYRRGNSSPGFHEHMVICKKHMNTENNKT